MPASECNGVRLRRGERRSRGVLVKPAPAGCRGGAGAPRPGGGDRGRPHRSRWARGPRGPDPAPPASPLRARPGAALPETTRPARRRPRSGSAAPPLGARQGTAPAGKRPTRSATEPDPAQRPRRLKRDRDQPGRRPHPPTDPTRLSPHPERGWAALPEPHPARHSRSRSSGLATSGATVGRPCRRPPDRTRPTKPTQLSRPTTPGDRNPPPPASATGTRIAGDR